jgi:hypothetical protein
MTIKSTLLSPLMGVRIAWALTGTFHQDAQGSEGDDPIKDLKVPKALYACETVKPLQALINKYYTENAISDEKEKKYIQNAMISLYSHLRSLATVYCARELNFKENEVLRLEYLNFVKENINFGSELKDWLKALPTMAIGGITGITLATEFKTPDSMVWMTGILFSVLGFFVYEWWIVYSCRRKQWTYILLDFERTLYYKQYLKRVNRILENLYWDLNNLHKETFGEFYPCLDPATSNEGEISQFLNRLNEGVYPTFCPQVYKCISERGLLNTFISKGKSLVCDNPLSPELWPSCETGDDDARIYCEVRKDLEEQQRELRMMSKAAFTES